MSKEDKKKQLDAVKPKSYRIYGIFDFETNELLHVDMKPDMVMLLLELDYPDDERYDMVEFEVILH